MRKYKIPGGSIWGLMKEFLQHNPGYTISNTDEWLLDLKDNFFLFKCWQECRLFDNVSLLFQFILSKEKMKNQTATAATQWNYKKEIAYEKQPAEHSTRTRAKRKSADEKPPAERSTRTRAKRKSVIEQESINSDDDRKPATREACKR